MPESNKEIARDLVISPEAVKSHVKNLFTKLAAQWRAQAVPRPETRPSPRLLTPVGSRTGLQGGGSVIRRALSLPSTTAFQGFADPCRSRISGRSSIRRI